MLTGSVGVNSGSVDSSVGEASQRNQFEEQIARIWQALGTSKWSDLAKALGKKQSSISGAKKRREIPQNWLSILSQKYGLSIKWILTGTGPMKVVDIWTPPDSHVSAPVTPVPLGDISPAITLHEDLILASEVLDSKTPYATALHLNIHSFVTAVRQSAKNRELQNKLISQDQKLSAQGETIQQLQEECATVKNELEEVKNSVARLLATGDDDPSEAVA